MLQFFRRLFACRRKAKLERLVQLAAKMDELLIGSCTRLAPDTRQQLEAGREDLERQIRTLLSA
jgi:hypothetical protein